MSFLDLYQNDAAVSAHIQPNEAHDLPATPDEAFHASWSQGQLFSASNAGENSRAAALQDYLDDVEKKTGTNIAAKLDYGAAGGGMPISQLREQANAEIAKLNNPSVQPLNDDDLEQRAVAKSRDANDAYAQMTAREKSFRAGAAFTAGGVAAGATDPINLLALPLAPETEAVGILGAALRWGGVAGVSQAAIEATSSPFKEEVQPGYAASIAPVASVGEAFLGGAVLGGVTKGLGNLWTRVQTGQWPQSVRDAGNVIESEANVANTNVYPGTAGEVAHREALTGAIDNILKGEPVDVSHAITPEIETGAGLKGVPIAEAREAMAAAQGQGAGNVTVEKRDGFRDSWRAENEFGWVSASADPTSKIVEIHASSLKAGTPTGHGYGTALYKDIVDKALDEGYVVQSSRSVSIEARRMYEGLERKGYNVETVNPEGMKGKREPVYRITGAPEQAALPFEATAAEAKAQDANDVLASGVSEISRRAGYDMPAEEAAKIAAKLVKATPDEAQAMLQDLQVSPRQVADAPSRIPKEPETLEPINVEPPSKVVQSAEYEQAMRADIDRDRMTEDRGVPVDVDKNGEPVYRSVDAAMDEIDGLKLAADQITACAAPAVTEEAA